MLRWAQRKLSGRESIDRLALKAFEAGTGERAYGLFSAYGPVSLAAEAW
jgi:hypothetical protein